MIPNNTVEVKSGYYNNAVGDDLVDVVLAQSTTAEIVLVQVPCPVHFPLNNPHGAEVEEKGQRDYDDSDS